MSSQGPITVCGALVIILSPTININNNNNNTGEGAAGFLGSDANGDLVLQVGVGKYLEVCG